ncbi:MAG TPA: HNH endonuclease [Longimicrobium sp.]
MRDEVQDVFAAVRSARQQIKRRDAQRPIIQIIRRLASDLGHTPTQDELASAGVYHAVLQKVFGSAASAMILAGLFPNVPGRPPMDLPSEFAKDTEPTADEALLFARSERIRRAGVDVEPPTGDDRPEKREVSGRAFIRHPRVVAWVLEHANGRCESCGILGYETDDGDRFLEVHHVIPLAEGGPDVVTNAVAVCETCHGKLHRWKERRRMQQELYVKIARLTVPDILLRPRDTAEPEDDLVPSGGAA